MNIALWTAAGLLAVAYVGSGGLKMILGKERIRAVGGASAAWTDDVRPTTIKVIGALEVLGGLGLVLPALLGIAPNLVPVAALGLVMVMVGAAITRLTRREYTLMLVDLAYLAATCFVAWGRFGPEPFVG